MNALKELGSKSYEALERVANGAVTLNNGKFSDLGTFSVFNLNLPVIAPDSQVVTLFARDLIEGPYGLTSDQGLLMPTGLLIFSRTRDRLTAEGFIEIDNLRIVADGLIQGRRVGESGYLLPEDDHFDVDDKRLIRFQRRPARGEIDRSAYAYVGNNLVGDKSTYLPLLEIYDDQGRPRKAAVAVNPLARLVREVDVRYPLSPSQWRKFGHDPEIFLKFSTP